MTTPAVAWATSADVVNGPCAGATGEDAERLDAKLLVATQLLYLRTGMRWPGVVSDYYRPNSGRCGCSWGRPGCTRVPEIRLPGYPVVAIISVLIDGQEVNAETYRIDDKRWLVRLPDPETGVNDGWPCCQRHDLADSEPQTFSIAYTWGANPDHAGLAAVMALGCELSLAADPDTAGSCRLPKGVVTAITRQGVSIQLTNVIDLDHCGLPEVTMWLAALDAAHSGKLQGARIVDPAALARRGRPARRPYVPGS